MLVRAFAIGITFVPALFAAPAAARAEANILTCVLERVGSEFKGTCEVPCSVNVLAIDIDGPNPKKACDSPPRSVQAALHETSGGNWLGTMQGKFPEDPTRFELLASTGARPSVARPRLVGFLYKTRNGRTTR